MCRRRRQGEQARVVPDETIFFCCCFCQTRKYATQLFPFFDQKTFFKSEAKQETPNFLLRHQNTKTTNLTQLCAHTSCGVDTRTRNHPERNFKAGRENSRLIDCCWSTFNDRNPIRAGDSRFHTTTQSNSTFINTLRCDSRRSAVLELCVCVLSKFSRPLNAH